MLRVLRVLVLFVVLGVQSTVAFAAKVEPKKFDLVDGGGVSLHLARYQTAGGGGNRGPILLVHGLTYSSHVFDVDYGDYSLVNFLLDNGYTVWLLDIAGYGSSGAVADGYTPNSDYAAEDIKAAAERIIKETPGTTKLDVLGWSWGTLTSSRFAVKYPELVNKLVLYAPILWGFGEFVKADTPYHVNTWAQAAEDFQLKDGAIDYTIIERPVVDTFISNCWRYDGAESPNGGRRDLTATLGQPLVDTAKIEAQTLLITGGEDPNVQGFLPLCEAAVSGDANLTLKVIPGGAHAMMIEKPYYKEFRESVLAFLTTGKPDVAPKSSGSSGCSAAGWGAGTLALGGAIAAARRKKSKARVSIRS